MATEDAEVKNKDVEQLSQTDAFAEIDEPFFDGFNWNTIAAMLFIGIVMLPGGIYLGLVSGVSIGGAAEWVTIILFLEIAKRSFVRLKRQELLIIFWAALGLTSFGAGGAGLYGGVFGKLIWNQFLVQAPQAEMIADHIPTWAVPPATSEALADRTFWHHDWIAPIIVILVWEVIHWTNMVSLGYIMYRVTSDIEELPYPMAPVKAGGATALAETSQGQEGWRWRVFSIGTVIGLVWGSVYIVIPTLSGSFLTETVTVIPIPFLDFTPNLRAVLPAAVLAIQTDIAGILAGFVLPYWVVVGTFVGSMIKNFVLNPIFYHYGIIYRWEPGMSVIPTTVAMDFDFWLSAKIGGAIAVLLISFYAFYRRMKDKSAEIEEGSGLDARKVGYGSGRGDVPLWVPVAAWAGVTTMSVIVVQILVPEFPWYITAFFGFVFTPAMSYVSAKMIGITGQQANVQFPYVREGAIFLSGVKGADVWFAPMPIGYYGDKAQIFREMVLTRTKFVSYVKLVVVQLIILTIFSFIFWTLIWRMTQIPSSAYPYVQKIWPFHAMMQSLWISSTLPGGNDILLEVVTLNKISAMFIATIAVYVPFAILKAPMTLFYGLMGGFTTLPWVTTLPFVGAMLNKYYFFKKFGQRTWKQYAPILLAGYSCGMGLIAMSSIAVSLVVKSISAVVY